MWSLEMIGFFIGIGLIITVGAYFALKYYFEAEDYNDLASKMF